MKERVDLKERADLKGKKKNESQFFWFPFLFFSPFSPGLSVLVFAEQSGGALSPFSLNAIGAANKLGGDITAVVCGADAGPAAAVRFSFLLLDVVVFVRLGFVKKKETHYSSQKDLGKTEGVKKVIHANNAGFENAVAESVTQYLYDLQQKESFSHIIAPATSSPKVTPSKLLPPSPPAKHLSSFSKSHSPLSHLSSPEHLPSSGCQIGCLPHVRGHRNSLREQIYPSYLCRKCPCHY